MVSNELFVEDGEARPWKPSLWARSSQPSPARTLDDFWSIVALLFSQFWS